MAYIQLQFGTRKTRTYWKNGKECLSMATVTRLHVNPKVVEETQKDIEKKLWEWLNDNPEWDYFQAEIVNKPFRTATIKLPAEWTDGVLGTYFRTWAEIMPEVYKMLADYFASELGQEEPS